MRRRADASRSALDDRRRFLLGSIEHALGDLHVFQRQMILIRPQLLGFRAELLAPHVAEDVFQPPPRFLRRAIPSSRPPASAPIAPSGARSHRGAQRYPCAFQARAASRARQKAPESLCRSLSRKLRTPRLQDEQVANPTPRTRPRTSPAISASRRREPGPYELATLQPLVHQHQSRSVPDQNLHTVSPFRAEHKGRAAEWIKPNISCTIAASPSWPLRKSTGRVAMYIFRSAPGVIIVTHASPGSPRTAARPRCRPPSGSRRRRSRSRASIAGPDAASYALFHHQRRKHRRTPLTATTASLPKRRRQS